MRTLALALACVGGLGCGGAPSARESPVTSPHPAPESSPAVIAVKAQTPTAVPADPIAIGGPTDPRPSAFVAFSGQCPPGHERFESVCVHEDYMRHTPLTRLMDEVIAFRNGAPAPRLGSAPGQQAAPDALSADATRKPIDPSTLDPGALVAKPEELDERERSVDEAARHRGQPDAPNVANGNAAPSTTASAAANGATTSADVLKQQLERMLLGSSAAPARAEGEAAAQDGPLDTRPHLDEQNDEHGEQPGLSRADCDNARAMAAEQRRTNCGMPPSEAGYCRGMLPQIEAAANALCAITR